MLLKIKEGLDMRLVDIAQRELSILLHKDIAGISETYIKLYCCPTQLRSISVLKIPQCDGGKTQKICYQCWGREY
jgi:hypothetical protein